MAPPTGGCPGSPQSPPLRGTHTVAGGCSAAQPVSSDHEDTRSEVRKCDGTGPAGSQCDDPFRPLKVETRVRTPLGLLSSRGQLPAAAKHRRQFLRLGGGGEDDALRGLCDRAQPGDQISRLWIRRSWTAKTNGPGIWQAVTMESRLVRNRPAISAPVRSWRDKQKQRTAWRRMASFSAGLYRTRASLRKTASPR